MTKIIKVSMYIVFALFCMMGVVILLPIMFIQLIVYGLMYLLSMKGGRYDY